MAEGSKVRFVRCPKCHNILGELPEYSVYRCGGCGSILRARSYISYTPGEPELLDYLQGLATNRDAVTQHDLQSSLFFSYGEEESASTSTVQLNDVNRLSFSSDEFSFFSDDIED